MKKMRVIFNPAAYGGSVRKLAPELRERLGSGAAERGVALEWVETQAVGHGIELAQDAALDGCDVVAAVGGDGTVNEVVNGLMQASQQGRQATLGVIPVGTGNDFAWMTGISLDRVEACQRLFDGQTRVVDVGHIREADGRERYFDNGCGVGFDARVSLESQGLKRWLRGFLVYIAAVLKTIILHYYAPALRMTFDERQLTRPTMMLTIGNGQRHGGGFLATPYAKQDDGLLEACVVGKFRRLSMLMIIPSFIRGTHGAHERILMERARYITVDAPEPQVIHLDGEIFATDARQFEVRVVPGSLRVRV